MIQLFSYKTLHIAFDNIIVHISVRIETFYFSALGTYISRKPPWSTCCLGRLTTAFLSTPPLVHFSQHCNN